MNCKRRAGGWSANTTRISTPDLSRRPQTNCGALFTIFVRILGRPKTLPPVVMLPGFRQLSKHPVTCAHASSIPCWATSASNHFPKS